MLAGFRLNLTALSLVSLLVGMFLVYNSVAASVVRRRREIGIFRAMGVRRREVTGLFLGEALCYGVVGVVIGWVGGVFLAQGMLESVGETIQAHYLRMRLAEAQLTAPAFLLSGCAGIGAALLAAWGPAREGAATPPALVLHGGSRAPELSFRTFPMAMAGLVSLGLALAFSLSALGAGPAWFGFVSAFLVLAGGALLAPMSCLLLARLVAMGTSGIVLWQLAARNLGRSLRRNGVTAAALMIALAMMTGITVMVHSFRESVAVWIEGVVVADVFVAPAANELTGPRTFLPEEVKGFFVQQPGVEGFGTYRQEQVRMEGVGEVMLAAVGGDQRQRFEFRRGDPGQLRRNFVAGEELWISEVLSRRLGFAEGDSMSLMTSDGFVEFKVGGVYHDYTSDQGLILMHRDLFEEHWDDARYHSLAIFLDSGARAMDLVERFRDHWAGGVPIAIYSNRELRDRIFEVFDQTFAVTWVLRSIALVVAVAGVCLGMGILVGERSRELALLRTLGAKREQVLGMILNEALLLGMAALVLGLTVGTALAAVLTWVVNRAFFGWTIQWSTPWDLYWTTPLWLIPVVLLAAAWPAWKGGRTDLNQALREE